MRKKSFTLRSLFVLFALFFLLFLPGSPLFAAWECGYITVVSGSCFSCHNGQLYQTTEIYFMPDPSPNSVGEGNMYIKYDKDDLDYYMYSIGSATNPSLIYDYYSIPDVDVTETTDGLSLSFSDADSPPGVIPAGVTGWLMSILFINIINNIYPEVSDFCITDMGADLEGWCELPTCCNVIIIPETATVDSGEQLEFFSNSRYCSEPSSCSWEVTSMIGSTINASGIYTAGINDTGGSVQDEVEVIDEANNSVYDTATVTVLTLPCEVAITPKSEGVITGRTIQFSASEEQASCDTPCYTWEISSSAGSTINADGLYTAGSGAGIDTVTVIDPCNGDITDFATVNIALDSDDDGIADDEDNCPDAPNGQDLGTCVHCNDGTIGSSCTDNGQCADGYCSMDQENYDGDGLGDVCDVDIGEDNYPPGGNDCIDACECKGDFNSDGMVTGAELGQFAVDFGRADCPVCLTDPWCVY